MKEFIPVATQFINLPTDWILSRGGILRNGRIAYETLGSLNEERDNAILVMTGLSPDAHIASHGGDSTPGWWENMVGPDKPIDTNYWHVICINSLGSCKGSTGAASINPLKGEAYRLDFPNLSIEDIADAAAIAIRALGIKQLACVIGASMGGMSSLALISQHPGLTRSHINISGAVHALPFAIAIRAMQREAIQSDPDWKQGQYDEEVYPLRGMLMARKLGVMTYRSAQEWEDRFGRSSLAQWRDTPEYPFNMEFAVEGYIECLARRFARAFDPNSYLYLSRSMDWFDLGEYLGCDADAALSRINLEKALVIGVETDILFPLKQQGQIANGLRAGCNDVTFLPLKSPMGHDAFLVDMGRFGPPVAKFLSALQSKPSVKDGQKH